VLSDPAIEDLRKIKAGTDVFAHDADSSAMVQRARGSITIGRRCLCGNKCTCAIDTAGIIAVHMVGQLNRCICSAWTSTFSILTKVILWDTYANQWMRHIETTHVVKGWHYRCSVLRAMTKIFARAKLVIINVCTAACIVNIRRCSLFLSFTLDLL